MLYSRDTLKLEETALFDAHKIIAERLKTIPTNAPVEIFLTALNADIYVINQYMESVQIRKGVCSCCGYTPCECPESDEVDTAPFDVMRHLGLPQ